MTRPEIAHPAQTPIQDTPGPMLRTALDAKPEVFGAGVIKGLYVTLKNLVTSYFCPRDRGGIFTVQYPEERAPAVENYRNFPVLVYDGTPDKLRCVACGICERECPVKCIHIEMETDASQKPLRKPSVFEIDYGLCMNCGTCEEVCPFDSIYMDHAFEVTASDRGQGLLLSKGSLLRSSDYLRKIRPAVATLADQQRQAAEAKKKAVPATPKPNP